MSSGISADRAHAYRWLVVLLAVSTVARLAMAGILDFQPDESYALAVSGLFQWSFFDHPPLAFWIVGLVQVVFGHGVSPVLARLPFVLMFTAASWAMFALTLRAFGATAGLLASGFLSLAPFFFLSAGSWIVPDGPLILMLLLTALFLMRALEAPGGAWRDWLLMGLCAGLALLSKYQAVVVIAGALGFIAATPHRIWLRRPQPYAAAALALLVFSPVLAWNVAHDWISIRFQLGRGAGPLHLELQGALITIAGEAVYLLPWTLAGLLLAAARIRSSATALLLWLGLPVVILFNALALVAPNALPHWSMPGWLFLFPLLGALASRALTEGRRWPAISLAASALSVAALCLAAILVISNWRVITGIPGADRALAEGTSWTGVRDGLAGAGLLDRPNTFYAAGNWLAGGRLAEAVRPHSPVAVFGGDPRGFAFLSNINSRLGQDAIVAMSPDEASGMADFLAAHFSSVQTVATFETFKGGQPAFATTVLLAHDFTVPVEIPYGLGASRR